VNYLKKNIENVRILIIEDQLGPMDVYDINFDMAKLEHPELDNLKIDFATNFLDAKEKIQNEQYDLIFLDHRMPYEDLGDLQKIDFSAFCHKLKNIGYGLIDEIKHKQNKVLIIGTSSLCKEEFDNYTIPDKTIDKDDIVNEIVNFLFTN